MKKALVWGAVVVVIIVGAVLFNRDTSTNETQDLSLAPASEDKDEQVMEPVEEIALEPVDGFDGSSDATRVLRGSQFIHTVKAQMRDPLEGKFYEGWVVRKDPLSVVSTGKLEKNDGTYELNFSSETDLFDHNDVVITEETASLGLDGKPEAHVLNGSF